MVVQSWIFILLGIVLLYFGAEWLVRGAASVAARLGLTPLVIGLTVVALGTSMPEMVVSVSAALGGNSAIAVGNVVGSNIGNIALILGLSAVVSPPRVQAQVIRFDVPVLLLASVLLALFLADGGIERWEAGLLASGLLLYVFVSLRAAKQESAEVEAEFAEGVPGRSGRLWLDALLIVVGLALLVAGARLLVTGAVAIALGLGMSPAVVGLTIVAIGTSLPELATSMIAAARGEGDIAVGNVVGSNVFNTFGIVGVAGLVRPLEAGGVGVVDVGFMLVLTLVMLPLMRTGFRVSRPEGAGLLLAYGGYLVYLLR